MDCSKRSSALLMRSALCLSPSDLPGFLPRYAHEAVSSKLSRLDRAKTASRSALPQANGVARVNLPTTTAAKLLMAASPVPAIAATAGHWWKGQRSFRLSPQQGRPRVCCLNAAGRIVAALIELSPRDRRVAENRYRLLKQHLERTASPLAMYLVDGASLIYAEGSVATSRTIVSGTEDDRFDVDAIVEIDVPDDWDDNKALDLLEEALQGFPGVVKIVRGTRRVQLRFPFMHMDVTIMDRRAKIAVERAPDMGEASRVASNPWGFTSWFRGAVGAGQEAFAATLRDHRLSVVAKNRLTLIDENERIVVAKAEQVVDDLRHAAQRGH